MTSAASLIYPGIPSPGQAATGNACSLITLAVPDMTCGGCMRKVEAALSAIPDVISARANLSEKRATVAMRTADAAPLIEALRKAGFEAAELAGEPNTKRKTGHFLLTRIAVAGFAAANIMLLSVSAWSGASAADGSEDLFHWLSALIALPVVAYAGHPFFGSAWGALTKRRVNMDVPISLAILLSAFMSLYQSVRGSDQVYFDACITLLFFLLIGRYLDEHVRSRARGAAENLLSLKADWANVIGADGAVQRLPARHLQKGMRIAVAAGERFPADGKVETGTGTIDEGLITGETTPRTVAQGDVVYAGAVNLSAPLTVEVAGAEGDTLIAKIARMMATAEQARGRYVRLADRAARFYAPMVHTLAAITFIGWLLAGVSWPEALTIAVAVLIVTCPCALALAVPAIQVAASARLFAQGTLVKAADGLERIAEADTVIFDKTGTLTMGMPALANGDEIGDETLQAAGALAANSLHPYAKAVARAARARFGTLTIADGVTENPGAGLLRKSEAGEERLGSATWCGRSDDEDSASLWYAPAKGISVAFHFVDQLRPDAKETVRAIQAAGFAVELLSGDREQAVAAAAKAAGISRWRACMKPQDKIARLEELTAGGARVLMVGDGLNDAPALAAAHASLSPVSAASISQTASDAVFQHASLRAVVELLATSRQARKMAFENFAMALGYNLVFVPLAMAGYVTPLIAAIAMSTSSITVTANAIRLRTIALRLEP